MLVACSCKQEQVAGSRSLVKHIRHQKENAVK